MPVYQFKCTNSGATCDVVRPVPDRDLPPTPDEAPGTLPPDGGWVWVRQILPPKVAFGHNWSPDGRGLKGRH
jgi:hypothetical protein